MMKLWVVMNLTLLLLFAFIFGILGAVGYYVGISGYIIVFLAILVVFFQWLIGPKIIWWTTNMRLIKDDEYPELWKCVREICKKNKTPVPRLAIVRTGSPNAFIFGRTPSSATLAVTQGLLKTLNENEIKAVIAHEIGHLKHKDMIYLTVVGSIPVILYFIARFLIFAPRKDERRGGAAIVIGLVAFLLYFITNLLVLLLSRLREYYADYFSAVNTKPRDLINALVKITYGLSISRERGNEAVRTFYIADPLSATKEVSTFSSEYADLEIDEKELEKAMEWEKRNPLVKFLEIFQTHPLTYKRIMALRKLEERR